MDKMNLNSRAAQAIRSASLIIVYSFFPVLIIGIIWLVGVFEKDPDLGERAEAIFLAIMFAVGALACVALVTISTPKVKSDRFPYLFPDYDTWLDSFLQTVELYQYGLIQKKKLNGGELLLFAKKNQTNPLSCTAIIRAPQLTNEFAEQANDAITEGIKAYLSCTRIRKDVDIISIFCVDRVSSAFYSMVDCHMRQGIKNGRIAAGISFSGKQLYVGNFSEGFGKAKYIKLRRQLLLITRIEDA